MRRRLMIGAGIVAVLAAIGGFLAISTGPQATLADLRYADRSPRNVFDLYFPEIVMRPPPVVMWIHGGGFSAGDKSDPEAVEELLEAGFAVIAMNYRLSGEAEWPAQLEDVIAAVRFVQDQGAAMSVDGSRIALFGASAGGFLAATAGAALAGRDGPGVLAVVNWFGPVAFASMDADMEAHASAQGLERATGRNDAAGSAESALIGVTVGDAPEVARAVSPLAFIERLPPGARLPPYLIMHGDQDRFIAPRQSERLRDAIEASPASGGVDYDLVRGGGHGDGAFDELATRERVVSFLTGLLRPGS